LISCFQRWAGIEILRGIGAMEIQTPVIFLTAKESERDVVHGLTLRFDVIGLSLLFAGGVIFLFRLGGRDL
jgi:hypothetical protein